MVSLKASKSEQFWRISTQKEKLSVIRQIQITTKSAHSFSNTTILLFLQAVGVVGGDGIMKYA